MHLMETLEQMDGRTYPPVGRCIYCGSTDTLTDEHIIPLALNGTGLLPKSSCVACAKITNSAGQTARRHLVCRDLLVDLSQRLRQVLGEAGRFDDRLPKALELLRLRLGEAPSIRRISSSFCVCGSSAIVFVLEDTLYIFACRNRQPTAKRPDR